MSKKLLLIANPTSGTGAIKTKLLPVIDILTRAGYEVSVHVTRSKGDATYIARSRGEDFDVIVPCGGDGTVNEVVSGIATMDNPPTLGVLPSGSVNDYAYSIGMPKGIIAAAKALAEGETFRCDTGFVNGRPFAYCAAFGAFTDIPYATPQDLKNALGPIAYGLHGISRLGTYKEQKVRIEYDGNETEEDVFLGMVSNTISIGGVRRMFDSVANLDDGKVELTLVRFPRDLTDYQMLINVLLGLEHVDNREDFVKVINLSHAKLTFENEIAWTIDGEDGGLISEAEIDVRHSHIPVIRGDRDKTYTDAPL